MRRTESRPDWADMRAWPAQKDRGQHESVSHESVSSCGFARVGFVMWFRTSRFRTSTVHGGPRRRPSKTERKSQCFSLPSAHLHGVGVAQGRHSVQLTPEGRAFQSRHAATDGSLVRTRRARARRAPAAPRRGCTLARPRGTGENGTASAEWIMRCDIRFYPIGLFVVYWP